MNKSSHYDTVIIGAGMSGLAAGIRLAHFGKKVCIFERHNAAGGLNSFYSQQGRKFDVGLHALTNFVRPGVKGTPLTKLLRQLRISRDEFQLSEQKRSRVCFGPNGETSLNFTNDFEVFESEVARVFPNQIDGFRKLVAKVREYDDVSLDAKPISARQVVREFVSDALLEDMIFCPVMYYGSAQERDMEFGQFVIMFKALLLEGFARPFDGVRVILRVLTDKYRAAGGERRMKCGVRRIIPNGDRASAVELDDGQTITADHVISSIGGPETERLWTQPTKKTVSPVGALSFVETITVLDQQPAALGWGDDTIIFFNDSERFDYVAAQDQVDPRSGVICFPNNFAYADGQTLEEGVFRCTCLANYGAWKGLPETDYLAAKAEWYGRIQASALRFLPAVDPTALRKATIGTDMFTPRTVEKFTGHLGGAIYGSPLKHRQGRTSLENVYICGTDQGFLGIIGAMLSGISMANYHILRGS
ncbi:MAG: NAD(P)/FAD-dependent oxidoreductase [Opitutaceae bacterium]